METVYKYPFQIEDDIQLSMPADAEILGVQAQNDNPCVWARVNPEAVDIIRHFRLAGTGHPLSSEAGKYVGTFQLVGGARVFHLFECPVL